MPYTCQLAKMVDAATINMKSSTVDRRQKLLDEWMYDVSESKSTDDGDNAEGADREMGNSAESKSPDKDEDGAEDLRKMADKELQRMYWLMKRKGIAIELRGDGAYDTREIFSLLARLEIIPIIKVRINANARAGGVDRARALAVLEQLSGKGGCTNRELNRMRKDERLANQKDWKKRVRAGLRWIVEIVISAFKRIFGEFVRTLTPLTTYIEIATKVAAYNHSLSIGDEAVQKMRDRYKTAKVPEWQAMLGEVAA